MTEMRVVLTALVLFLATGTAHLLVTGVAALSVLSASAAQGAPAAEEMPSFEAVKEFAHQLFEMSKKQGLSERETANHLASSMWWSEKMQVLCPSYFYASGLSTSGVFVELR